VRFTASITVDGQKHKSNEDPRAHSTRPLRQVTTSASDKRVEESAQTGLFRAQKSRKIDKNRNGFWHVLLIINDLSLLFDVLLPEITPC
jgi:hypothetical protein